MSDQPAAIRATFSDYRTVKGRKVLQIVMEVPIEQQAAVFEALGYPVPDADLWCAIARLNEQPIEPASRRDAPSPSAAERPGVEAGISPTALARASQFAKERYQEASPISRALTRAALLAKDERFQAWACQQKYGIAETGLVTLGADITAQFIRDHCCNGESRKLIATDPEAYRKFLALERLFHEAIGVVPEMRF